MAIGMRGDYETADRTDQASQVDESELVLAAYQRANAKRIVQAMMEYEPTEEELAHTKAWLLANAQATEQPDIAREQQEIADNYWRLRAYVCASRIPEAAIAAVASDPTLFTPALNVAHRYRPTPARRPEPLRLLVPRAF